MSSTEITARCSRVIYISDDNLFTVAEFIDINSAKRFKSSGTLQLSPKADVKQDYKLIGEWQNNPKYGEVFAAFYAEAVRPTELKGLIPYLSHNVKGVGEATAKKLLEHLSVKNNDDLISICKQEPDKIYQFFGTKKKIVADRLIHAMVIDEIYRSIMIFLHEHNIQAHFAKKIYEKYAAKSIALLKENPYRLISDFRRVGFLKADSIAMKLGISKTSHFRIEAALIFSLEQALDEGHCYLPRDILIEKMCANLGGVNDPTFTYDFILEETRKIYKKNKQDQIESFLIREAQLEESRLPSALFYLPEVFNMENEVAGFLSGLVHNQAIGHEFKEKKYLEDIQSANKGIEDCFQDIPWGNLSAEQKQAVELSLSSRIMILTGGPGCGKTFVLKSIYALQKQLQRRVVLCAPTGLAAKRMTASIGEQAFTIHKLLGLARKEQQQEEPATEALETAFDPKLLSKVDVIIVDESSMLSLELLHSLLKAAGLNKRFVFVGDVDQLPSIGHGNCLRDMISSEVVPTVKLTKIFRQKNDSPIPTSAKQIIEGQLPAFSSVQYTTRFQGIESFAQVPCQKDHFLELLTVFLKETVPRVYKLDPVKDCQILIPMRKSIVGCENVNQVIQQELNPIIIDAEQYKHPQGFLLRALDKVIQTKNNYELDVFNGDLGFVQKIQKNNDSTEITVEFSHKTVTYVDEQAEELQLCYAMTVHKSQGSEFPLCIIPIFGVYFSMLERNLLYTAVTRASRHVILFGERWALKKCIETQTSIKRFTMLEKLLKN